MQEMKIPRSVAARENRAFILFPLALHAPVPACLYLIWQKVITGQRRQAQGISARDLQRRCRPLRMMKDGVEIAPVALDRMVAEEAVRATQIEDAIDPTLQ